MSAKHIFTIVAVGAMLLVACGHFIHMEQAELFNEKLKEFIFK